MIEHLDVGYGAIGLYRGYKLFMKGGPVFVLTTEFRQFKFGHLQVSHGQNRICDFKSLDTTANFYKLRISFVSNSSASSNSFSISASVSGKRFKTAPFRKPASFKRFQLFFDSSQIAEINSGDLFFFLVKNWSAFHFYFGGHTNDCRSGSFHLFKRLTLIG